jgi:hypothetical protein
MKFPILVLLLTFSILSFAQSEQPKDKIHVRIDFENPKHTISKYLTESHFVYAIESNELYNDERIGQ